jgi:hypothetical protein
MKTSQLIFVCLLVCVLSSALGYFAGWRRGFHKAHTEEWSNYMERGSENVEFEARAYYRCLQDIDSGNITNLHAFALDHLQLYVGDVRRSYEMGFDWAPHIPTLYSNATIYVAEHPKQK